MVPVLHEDEFDIGGSQRRHQFLGLGPWHVGVRRSVDQAHRDVEGQRPGEHPMVPALFEQASGDHIGPARIFGRGLKIALGGWYGAPRARDDAAMSSVKSAMVTSPATCWDPAVSASALATSVAIQPPMEEPIRTSPSLRPSKPVAACWMMVSVIAPAADGAVAERAARRTVSGIVQTEKTATCFPRPVLQNGCLLARHVRHKATKEHNAGSCIGTRRRRCTECQPRAVFGRDEIGYRDHRNRKASRMNEVADSSTGPDPERQAEAARQQTAARLPVVLQVLPSLDVGGGGVERSAIDVAEALVLAGKPAIVASKAAARWWNWNGAAPNISNCPWPPRTLGHAPEHSAPGRCDRT